MQISRPLCLIGGVAEPAMNAPAGGLNIRLHLFLRVSGNVRDLPVGTALDEEQEVTRPVLFGQGTEETDQFRDHHLLFRRDRRSSAIPKCRSFDVFHLRLTTPQLGEADVPRNRDQPGPEIVFTLPFSKSIDLLDRAPEGLLHAIFGKLSVPVDFVCDAIETFPVAVKQNLERLGRPSLFEAAYKKSIICALCLFLSR